MTDIVGINWGSSAFRAYRLAPDGEVMEEWSEPAGVLSLDRAGMAALMERLQERWPGVGPVYASGMIGSTVGWTEAPYLECPASFEKLARAIMWARIGPIEVGIVPGLACRRAADGAPDVLRGEELELFGLLADAAEVGAERIVTLPGTHTKWALHTDHQILEFATSMTGEIYDRMTAAGLLAGVVEGQAVRGEVFRAAVRLGHDRALGLGALLFGVRARVVRGEMSKADAASHLRGLLIGSDLADARQLYPVLGEHEVSLIGNPALSALYQAAFETLGLRARLVDGRAAVASGFVALNRMLAVGQRT
jgi:2-dehydro-3-deoxygalactonokinase